MKTRYKYLILLGILPGMAFAQEKEVKPEKAETYNKEKITERAITVGAEGFELPGTLTLPMEASAEHKVPCIILVHGSGPNDRDESIGPNKPFRDLAWGLAERGIATIRYDKRTKVYGARCVPTGRELDYDTEAVDDAVSIVHQAGELEEIDRIFLLGHSLGGSLAPRIAQRSEKLAGIIIVAGMARRFEDVVVEQVEYIASLNTPSEEVKAQLEMLKQQAANVKKLDSFEFDNTIPLPLGLPASYWRMALQYNPTQVASTLKQPILVLQGERDYQVTMLDFSLWQIALMGKANAAFKAYPDLNHLMQEGKGKATPQEYMQVAPFAGYVIDDIANFIHQQRG